MKEVPDSGDNLISSKNLQYSVRQPFFREAFTPYCWVPDRWVPAFGNKSWVGLALEEVAKKIFSMALRLDTRMPAAARSCDFPATYGTAKAVPFRKIMRQSSFS